MTGADPATPLYLNRARATSFGQLAAVYDRTRPSYPDALVELLVASGARSVLDVGCGTGLLGRQFLARGLSVLGVEPDEQMAAVAASHGLVVETSTFEDWRDDGRTFDLLVSGQAWHWVEPRQGAARAATVVAPGGTAALAWNHATMPEDLAELLAPVYARSAPSSVTPVVANRDVVHEESAERLFPATGRFAPPESSVFAWRCTYGRQQWLDQLLTHSDHRLMADADRATLLAEVGRAIDDYGGSFEMHYECEVSTFVHL